MNTTTTSRAFGHFAALAACLILVAGLAGCGSEKTQHSHNDADAGRIELAGVAPMATLDEIVVTAMRLPGRAAHGAALAVARAAADAPMLPEIVVTAKRLASTRTPEPSTSPLAALAY